MEVLSPFPKLTFTVSQASPWRESTTMDWRSYKPNTYPVTSLPIMNCGRPKAAHCSVAPMTIIEDPRKMVFRRPNMLPSHIVAMAPKKLPTLYDATEIPKKSVKVQK